jgi:hypothetical protein
MVRRPRYGTAGYRVRTGSQQQKEATIGPGANCPLRFGGEEHEESVVKVMDVADISEPGEIVGHEPGLQAVGI